MNRELLPECYADTLLVEILEYEKPNHCFCIGEVSNTMQKKYVNKVAIGVTDKDKPGNIPIYLTEFQMLVGASGLELKWHQETKHYLIVIEPALEQWLLSTAEDLSVDASKYGFKNLKTLKDATKSQKAGENQKLKDFLNALKQKKGSPCQVMIGWIDLVLNEKGDIGKIKKALGIES